METTKRGWPLWSVASDTVSTSAPMGELIENLEISWMLSKSTRERREMFPSRWARIKYSPPGSNSQNIVGVDPEDLKRGKGFVSTVCSTQYRSSRACPTTNARSSSVERAVRGRM